MKTIRQIYFDVVRGFTNIWDWFGTIWRDRDFDNHYIEVILHKKLLNTYNFFQSEYAVTDWEHEDSAKALKALRICISILERRQNEFYISICADVYDVEQIENIYKCERRDMEVFGKLLGKYLPYWWD
jgi:hypothetical protein